MPLDNRTCFQVNLRDKVQCQICHKQPASAENYHKGFEYHHRLPKSNGGSDAIDNIILLCHDCHKHQHRKLIGESIETKPQVEQFFCKQCQETLNSNTVVMNCGWYECSYCKQKTHLYDHFIASTFPNSEKPA